jgi:hypothetical protein
VSPESALDLRARDADIGIMDGRDAFADEHLAQISLAVVLTALGHDGFWVGLGPANLPLTVAKMFLFCSSVILSPSRVQFAL